MSRDTLRAGAVVHRGLSAQMEQSFLFARLRLRGLSGANNEVLLTATVQNLGQLATLLCRAPPCATTISNVQRKRPVASGVGVGADAPTPPPYR
jgi:hypothetical protein